MVRSPDAPSLSDNNSIVNVDKTKLTPHTSKWDRRRAMRIKRRLQGLEIQQATSKCILENLEQRLKAAEDHAKPSPSQPSPPNRQQQTAVERNEQAAPLSCQVSEVVMVWGGGNRSMGSNCSLPLPPSWGVNPVPTIGTPVLPT